MPDATPNTFKPGTLVLADGTSFVGQIPADSSNVGVGELVFTTSMLGYQEVITDPSYAGQIVTMTAPQMGNVGMNKDDDEATAPKLNGLVMMEASPQVSNWRAEEGLLAYLKRHHVPAFVGADTRALVHHLREHGAQMAAFGVGSIKDLLAEAKAAPSMQGRNLAYEVTTPVSYPFTETQHWHEPYAKESLHVVALDFGIKKNILHHLKKRGCKITVAPATITYDALMALKPDGVFLSNGPGDPEPLYPTIELIKKILGKIPVFGICLGHQLLGLALGAKTFKMKFGHRGVNHPVQNLKTGIIEITAQNHGFAVDPSTLPGQATMSHVHLNDQTCMGIEAPSLKAFSVQFHPEASAGPHDSAYLFDTFISMIKADKSISST